MTEQTTGQEILEYTHNMYLTVGRLKKSLENLPDDMPVAYQIIEDVYFDKMHWKSFPIKWGYDYTDSVPAFGAYVWDGVFFIHAHY